MIQRNLSVTRFYKELKTSKHNFQFKITILFLNSHIPISTPGGETLILRLCEGFSWATRMRSRQLDTRPVSPQ